MDYTSEIKKLIKEKKALILAHHYQTEEVKALAHMVGDSLEMARYAKESDCNVLVVCGVSFMAQTAKILSPHKKVLLPNLLAGCSMADMVTKEDVISLKAKHPNALVVCYVNSSAEVKAESHICCTSSNALKIVASLGAKEIIFVPDKNLGSYVANQLPKTRVITHDGYCECHDFISASQVLKRKEEFPNSYLLAHPECRREVLQLADFVGSTSAMINHSRDVSQDVLIIGTEIGVIEKIRQLNPEKRVVPLDDSMICPTMKITYPRHIFEALDQGVNEVILDEDLSNRALKSIARMLELS